jgi:hypothetical protein
MKHLSEEELYALSQEASGSRNQHLRECPQCAAAYDEIKRVLEAATASGHINEPAPDYGEKVWAAIQGSLPVYGQKQPPRKWNWWGQNGRLIFAGALACLALVAAAFWAGSVWQQRQAREETAKWNRGAPGRVVFVVVRDHLDRSERLLMELDHAGHLTEIDRGPIAREASDLLEDNRLYRQTAAASNDPALAALLDRLGRVLIEVAHDPATLEGGASRTIREDMNLDGLLFELRVLRDKEGTVGRDRQGTTGSGKPASPKEDTEDAKEAKS